jgi:predicted DNA-binding transcriptional regulator AlpA
MVEKIQDQLAYPPRGLRAEAAARYLGMSKSKFLELVDKGRIPAGVHIDGLVIWDRLDLDAGFEALKAEERAGKRNTVDMVLGIDQ